MHVIVVGCGRVGASVARELTSRGHDVVVIDRRADAFRRLGDDFTGRTMSGVGFDRDVLIEAGITSSSAVAAVTNGDNSNILIARVAREMFGVSKVVARIYDARRAAVYERLGIPTVASVAWTAGRVLQTLLPASDDGRWVDASSRFGLLERRVQNDCAGMSIAQLDAAGLRVCLLTRHGLSKLPGADELVNEGDILHLMVPATETGELSELVSARTEEGHS